LTKRIALDTSVLVAAVIEPHPFHRRASRWIEAISAGRAAAECSWHAAAETWSVLTRLPLEPAISPALAEIAIERLLQKVAPVPLEAGTYRAALRRCSEHGLRSGAIFDALHLISAERRGVDAFVTFNPADFERLLADGSPRLVVPPDPPRFAL
jgi:predicted nucleic acid-binding protein